jgi:hypothetical protein
MGPFSQGVGFMSGGPGIPLGITLAFPEISGTRATAAERSDSLRKITRLLKANMRPWTAHQKKEPGRPPCSR